VTYDPLRTDVRAGLADGSVNGVGLGQARRMRNIPTMKDP